MAVRYVSNHIPKNTPHNRRPALRMVPTTITIHNTGNVLSSASGERAWLTNPVNSRQASYHIVIDEHGAIECIPLNENAWHAGDGASSTSGNRSSIGIELCESGNYAKTVENAVELVAKMLKDRGWGVDRLRRHYDWSGKICPRLMYNDGAWTGWHAFKERVAAKLNEGKAEVTDMQYDKANVKVNGKKIKDGVIIDGSVYVPLRGVSEALGADITWDNKAKLATINTKEAK